MIKIFSPATPATYDIIAHNSFNNNRNIKIINDNHYVSVSELNNHLESIPKDIDVILIDFVSDIIFGNVETDGEVITRNFWTNAFPEKAKRYSNPIDNETDLNIVIEDFFHFVNYVQKKGIKVIVNSFRYADSMTENNQGNLPLDEVFPSKKFRKKVNVLLEKIESVIGNYNSDLKIISFNEKCSKNEKNHPTKRYSFYMNDDYYVDTFVQLENILSLWYPNQVSSYASVSFDHIEKNTVFSSDTLLVVGPSELLRKAWSSSKINEGLTILAVNDYILDGKRGNEYRFIKRKKWYRRELSQFTAISGNQINYSDIVDVPRLKSGKPRQLVFFFLSMPGTKTFNSVNSKERLFPMMFSNFTRSLIKDTVVIRIADIDGVRGGFYVNSVNYSQYERDLAEFIDNKIEEYGIERKNVVLHGTSKGATGALYYGAKLDLNTVVIDPVIDGEYYISQERNSHFTKDFRVNTNLVPIINLNLANNHHATHFVFGNHFVHSTWDVLKQLVGVELIDIDDKTVTTHPKISPNSVPDWLAYINILLLGNQIVSMESYKVLQRKLEETNRLLAEFTKEKNYEKSNNIRNV